MNPAALKFTDIKVFTLQIRACIKFKLKKTFPAIFN